MNRALASAAAMLAALLLSAAGDQRVIAQTDLDAFMQQVLAKRDDNWKKLQQYVLDEREQIDVRGPNRSPLWGERRDYTWFIRDGFFVRSPVKINGVTLSERDRQTYEADFLKREQRREQRAAERARQGDPAPVREAPEDAPRDLDGLIRQTRQPQFISSAYFLRFKFDAGRYALVGKEQLDGGEVLRIEYYPSKLFSDDRRRDGSGDANRKEDTPYDRQMQRLMNKSSLVTLWVTPASQQIVKYTFDNLPWDFLPGQWLIRINDITASMTMGQPFPDVWLPRTLDMHVGTTLAIGDVDLQYALEYHDYRRADVTTKVGIPGVP